MPAGPVAGPGPSETTGAFVAKLSAAGDKILSSGIISGQASACGTGGSTCFLSAKRISASAIGVDSAGNAYVAGNSDVLVLPTTKGFLTPRGLGAWAARVNASGARLDYLTYLGAGEFYAAFIGQPATIVSGLAVDAAGNAYVVGGTSDSAFPATPGAFQSTYDGPAITTPVSPPTPPDGFVAKLNPQGLRWSTRHFSEDRTPILRQVSRSDAFGGRVRDRHDAVFRFSGHLQRIERERFHRRLESGWVGAGALARYPGGTVSGAIAVDSGGRVRVGGAVGIVSNLVLNATPDTVVLGIMSGAGELPFAARAPGNAVAPGEVVSIFGTQLGPSSAVVAEADSNGMMPTALAGTQVLFDGRAAPLLYVSQDQVNAVAPFELSPGRNTAIQVIAGTAKSPDFLVSSSEPNRRSSASALERL